MLAKVHSMGLFGIEAFPVEVEVDIARAEMPKMTLVGLPDASVKESVDRVRAALKNSGFPFPGGAVTINLAPADRRKEGPAFELPILIGLLQASEAYMPARDGRFAIVGELALDGRVRAVNGCLSVALQCRREGYDGIICPLDNAREAAIVDGIQAIPVAHVTEAVAFLSGSNTIKPIRLDLDGLFRKAAVYNMDLGEVRGQAHAKRALEIAAAGGHNLLMVGPPGAGKSMLAQRLCTILPPLALEESLETTSIHSVTGHLDRSTPLLATRPFRCPHHTVSDVGLVGGGAHPRPGEISLAHHGVLFLDELPEFSRSALEALRQPLEDGRATISRAAMAVTYPCQFMLVGAMNPCPCGYYTDPKHMCRCTPNQITKYRNRISGPLMDRIDIHVDVPPVEFDDLRPSRSGEPSAAVRERVMRARGRQRERFAGEGFFTNARMDVRHMERHCRLSGACETLLEQAMNSLGLSARAYSKILKVARTTADLEESGEIQPQHISEAIGYRSLDRLLE